MGYIRLKYVKITLSYNREKVKPYIICAKDQDRTGDPSLFRGMLYQLSYLGDYWYSAYLDVTYLSASWRKLPWRMKNFYGFNKSMNDPIPGLVVELPCI